MVLDLSRGLLHILLHIIREKQGKRGKSKEKGAPE
jgi:hypothetical protein